MENAGFSKVDQRRYDLPFDSSDNWVFKVNLGFLPILNLQYESKLSYQAPAKVIQPHVLGVATK